MIDPDSDWRRWPALEGIGNTQRWRLTCRPVRPDAPHAGSGGDMDSDQRTSDGVALGWLARGGRHRVAATAPGTRQGAVEMLEWINPRALPAVLGALCILPRVAASTAPTADPSQALGADELTIHLEALAVAEGIASGCRQLRERLDLEGLSAIYAEALSGVQDLGLPTGAPWPAGALAALLLPLERPLADGLSIRSTPWPAEANADGGIDGAEVGVPGRQADRPAAADANRLARAEQLARAVMENRPELALAPPRGVADGGPPTREVRLFGAASSGKTAYLARLFASLDHGGDPRWAVQLPPGANRAWFEDQLHALQGENRFPVATGAGRRDELVYRLRDSRADRSLLLALEDRPGADYERIDPDTTRRLASADALVLLLDPHRDRARQDEEVRRAFLAIQQARSDPDRDPRPLAVCISKCDAYVRDLSDLQRMRADPDALLERLIGKVVVDAVRHYWQHYRVFALSAAGLRLSHGAVEPSAFYDESLGLRINPEATPINLLEPLVWIFESLGE